MHAVPPGLNGDVSNLSFVVLHSTRAAPKALTKSFWNSSQYPWYAIPDLSLVRRQFQFEVV
jgi:hypothetical protein